MRFYQITANGVEESPGNWRRSFQVPTFYLRDDISGITSEMQAENIARAMLEALAPGSTFHITASAGPEMS